MNDHAVNRILLDHERRLISDEDFEKLGRKIMMTDCAGEFEPRELRIIWSAAKCWRLHLSMLVMAAEMRASYDAQIFKKMEETCRRGDFRR